MSPQPGSTLKRSWSKIRVSAHVGKPVPTPIKKNPTYLEWQLLSPASRAESKESWNPSQRAPCIICWGDDLATELSEFSAREMMSEARVGEKKKEKKLHSGQIEWCFKIDLQGFGWLTSGWANARHNVLCKVPQLKGGCECEIGLRGEGRQKYLLVSSPHLGQC